MKPDEECLNLIWEKIKNSYNQRKEEENVHYNKIQEGLDNSMTNIKQALIKYKSWDELMDIKDQSNEDKKSMLNKSVIKELKKEKDWFDIIGLIFCIFHLIGIQAGIIILNSLFSEIIDELKLWLSKTPRNNNFYEKLEINTYRELPEIDVAMVTSSIGIVFLREKGFKKTNSMFQLTSSILFTLLFVLFDFHTKDNLLYNYDRMEIVVLIVAYIFLSIIVGCSSTLALKEYFNLFSEVYFKNIKDSSIFGEKGLFFILSGISGLLIMIINRLIFTSFKDKTSKWLLLSIVGVCFGSFFLSLIFHYFYSIPIIDKKIKNENDKKEEKLEEDKKDDKNQEEIEEVKYNMNKYKEEDFEIEKNERSKSMKINNLVTNTNTETAVLKKNKTDYTKNSENIEIQIENIREVKEDEEVDNSTKICTLCGYIYVKKITGNQKACILYKYTSRCTWFKEKIIKFEVLSSIIIEFLCQFSIVGFNSILCDRLLEKFSFITCLKFYFALFIICIVLGLGSSVLYFHIEKNFIKNTKFEELKKNGWFCLNFYSFYLISLIIALFVFSLFTFSNSIKYLNEKNTTRQKWNNIIMAEFIFFKSIDMSILSFFDFYDSSDIFNTTLFITSEKVIWMFIEAIFDAAEIKDKYLIIIQIVFCSIPIACIVIFFIYSLLMCYRHC